MNLKINIWQALTALLAVVCLLLAWRLDNANSRIESMQRAQAVAEAQADAEKAKTEKAWRERLDEAQEKAKSDTDATEQAYQKALGALDLDPVSDPAGRVPERAAGDHRAEMPGASSAPVGVSAGANQCSRADRAELQRLYKKQLALARDCDTTARYYNEILHLWEQVRTSTAAVDKN